MSVRCDKCGSEYGLGEWPWCPHGRPQGMMTFRPYIDEHIAEHPIEITSWAQRKRIMRQRGLEFAERPPKGWFSEREDRCMEQRRERERAG